MGAPKGVKQQQTWDPDVRRAVSRIAAGVRWKDAKAEARARADLAAAKARQNRKQARALLEEAEALEAGQAAS